MKFNIFVMMASVSASTIDSFLGKFLSPPAVSACAGTLVEKSVLIEALEATGQVYRVYSDTDFVTMDFNPDRINVVFSHETGEITEVVFK